VAQTAAPGVVAKRAVPDTDLAITMVKGGTAAAAQMSVFVVSAADNQVRLKLDSFPLGATTGAPALGEPTAHAAYVDFHSDYGIYQGSIKYFYDVSGHAAVRKTRYQILALTSSTQENGKLRYQGSFVASERHAVVTIEPRAADALPGYTIVDAPPPDSAYREPAAVRVGSESVTVANQTPPGQQHRPSEITVVDRSGAKHAYPPPKPAMDFYRKTRPSRQPPLEIWSDIGAFVFSGGTVWFASTFYDGEGVSGVGAVGSFDIPSRKYQMRYLPEIVKWSGSAMRLDGDDLWIGLVRHPEGADISGGLLRYDTKTGATRKYDIPDVIHTIDRLGDGLYVGTSHGLYVLRGDWLTHLCFEPDERGKLVMVKKGVARVQP
jgi:hypothetical protein